MIWCCQLLSNFLFLSYYFGVCEKASGVKRCLNSLLEFFFHCGNSWNGSHTITIGGQNGIKGKCHFRLKSHLVKFCSIKYITVQINEFVYNLMGQIYTTQKTCKWCLPAAPVWWWVSRSYIGANVCAKKFHTNIAYLIF